MKKIIFLFIITFSVLLFLTSDAQAQCAMCRMAAENGAKAGNTQTLGINTAILYLAIFPYIIISTIAYLFWRAYKKKQKEEKELAS
ncbi:MAG: hypothetical protein H7Y00_12025 [Fimbriimonadaceae bacterium]|nr:hypothetical protein [Chitinophagales bacterium]